MTTCVASPAEPQGRPDQDIRVKILTLQKEAIRVASTLPETRLETYRVVRMLLEVAGSISDRHMTAERIDSFIELRTSHQDDPCFKTFRDILKLHVESLSLASQLGKSWQNTFDLVLEMTHVAGDTFLTDPTGIDRFCQIVKGMG